MKANIIQSTVINDYRIELVQWDGDEKLFVYIYDKEGMLNDNHSFYNRYAADQFYFNNLSRLAGSTP